MSAAVLRVRIRTEDKDDVEWSVRQDELTFGNTLFTISKVLPHVAVTAFEYEDEEGDRITVRSDEELQTMLADFFSFADVSEGYVPPLVIYPRVGKTPQDRNIHGLKIKIKTKKQDSTKPKVVIPPEQPPVEPVEAKPQSQSRSSGDIEDILACGNIKDTDLQYLEVLGNGTGGTVFRATHMPAGRMMAVKVIQLDITPDVQKQIISELKVLDQCQCDSIIMFYGAFFVENRISICAELMDGGSLDRFGQIPEPILGRMSVSIVRGLIYLWSKKIMHRDIKPSNILVNTQGQVKLCDFGVSTQLVNSIAKTYVGTNAYMAPERILGEDYSLPSEVWSLGVTLFELATGRFPYNAALFVNQPMQFLNCIVREPPPRLPAGFFSAELTEFVARCMQQSPQDRLKPAELGSHSFILRHSDGQMEQVVTWIQGRLQEIQSMQQATANR